MTKYRTKGFVFKKSERGEADRNFSVFTEDYGRLEILGRAIRKNVSKLRAGIDIFYFSEIEFVQGKNYKTLIDASINKKLTGTINNFQVGYQISEMLDKFIKGQEPDRELFDLLTEVVDKLNNCKKIELIYYYFVWNFLTMQGFGLNEDLRKIINSDVEKILQIILKKDWNILLRLKIDEKSLRLLKEVSSKAINSFCPS